MMMSQFGKTARAAAIANYEAVTHVESCLSADCEHPLMHETHTCCVLCHIGAPRDLEHFPHEDALSKQYVCKDCWKKCNEDSMEAGRLISGQASALDFDTARVLVA